MANKNPYTSGVLSSGNQAYGTRRGNPNYNTPVSGGKSYNRGGSIFKAPGALKGGGAGHKCPKGQAWDERGKVCVPMGSAKKSKPMKLSKSEQLRRKGAPDKLINNAMAVENRFEDEYNISPWSEQGQMLTDQEFDMWESPAEMNEFYNSYDESGAYGISDGFDYAQDQWVSDPGYNPDFWANGVGSDDNIDWNSEADSIFAEMDAFEEE